MGWSCGAHAGRRMDEISAACVKQTGSSNVFQHGEAYYMFEVSTVEHDDGAITGEILRFDGNPLGLDSCKAYPSGLFRIENDGRVSSGAYLLPGATS